MDEAPTILSDRLFLRTFTEADIPALTCLADDPRISQNAMRIPYPFTEDDARGWLATQREDALAGTGAVFAITEKGDGALMGACGLEVCREHRRAELGYWLGSGFWKKGYATEAATAVVGWGFSEMSLNRISATRLSHNPASGRVLEKIGMSQEGVLRRHVFHGGEFRDMVMYGILREEWERRG